MGVFFSPKLKDALQKAYQDVLINELVAGGTTLLGAQLAGFSKSQCLGNVGLVPISAEMLNFTPSSLLKEIQASMYFNKSRKYT